MDMSSLNASICIECMKKKIIDGLLLGGSEYCFFSPCADICPPKNLCIVFEATWKVNLSLADLGYVSVKVDLYLGLHIYARIGLHYEVDNFLHS